MDGEYVCDACLEKCTLQDPLKLGCKRNCSYCKECLERMFCLAMKDEESYPPRCLCFEAVSLPEAKSHLPASLVDEYESKIEEMDTKNKTYCHNVSCNNFIPPDDVQSNMAHCQKCSSITCHECKEASHSGPCSHPLAALAKKKGWQRCPDCRRMIEREEGCNHITCRCGCDFCYKCGEHDRSCGCLENSEDDDDDEDDDEDDEDDDEDEAGSDLVNK